MFRCKSGNVAIASAIIVPAIITTIFSTLEFNDASVKKESYQQALDAAVLAGISGKAENYQETSLKTFRSNLELSEQDKNLLTPSFNLVTADSGDKTTLKGSLVVDYDTNILSVLGVKKIPLNVNATAEKSATATQGPCIYVLNPKGSQSLLVNSGATIQADKCEVHVKSTANPAAIFNSGINLNLKKICIAGSKVIQNSVTVKNLFLSCAAEDNPFAGKITAPASATCTYSNLNYSGNVTLSPGVYCGWFNFNNSPNVTFLPGTYVLKNGGWNVNGGSFNGTGVSFYFSDNSKIQFNSGIAANLSAPTSGTYKDILFFEKETNSKAQFIFNSSVSNKLRGIIYLPTKEFVLNAQSKLESDAVTLVVWQLILNNTNWKLGQLSAADPNANNKIRLIK